MKIAATVILYYPDETVIENIFSYVNSVEKLYIVDNTETSSQLIRDNLNRLKNSVYLHDGENQGISSRLNKVSKLAMNDGFDWLLTMDQDSLFKNESFIAYLKCINSFEEKENVSMFGINHIKEVSTDTCICISEKVNHLITSGSILNLNLVSVIGGFDENLFIDEVDFEFCLRSISKGFLIIRFRNVFLNHNLGKTSFHRSFKTTKLTPRVLHSPLRMYYITRNFFYVQSKYRTTFRNEINLKRKLLLNRLKNNIIYNNGRFAVIKYMIKGFGDYRKNRMGKLK